LDWVLEGIVNLLLRLCCESFHFRTAIRLFPVCTWNWAFWCSEVTFCPSGRGDATTEWVVGFERRRNLGK